MRVDDLKPVDQEMLSRTLLPGEECRYMERASVCRWGWITCLEKLLEQGFVLTLFFFITAFSALVLLGWLRGSTSTVSLLVAYIFLLLFYLLGWMMSPSGARRRLRKQVYLLTTHRAMILQPGECIRAYPLLPGMVRHLEQRPDGTGHLFFQLPEKEGGFEEACFAFVPEPRRVETLLNELAAQVPPLPDSPAAPVDWEMLPRGCGSACSRSCVPMSRCNGWEKQLRPGSCNRRASAARPCWCCFWPCLAWGLVARPAGWMPGRSPLPVSLARFIWLLLRFVC